MVKDTQIWEEGRNLLVKETDTELMRPLAPPTDKEPHYRSSAFAGPLPDPSSSSILIFIQHHRGVPFQTTWTICLTRNGVQKVCVEWMDRVASHSVNTAEPLPLPFYALF